MPLIDRMVIHKPFLSFASSPSVKMRPSQPAGAFTECTFVMFPLYSYLYCNLTHKAKTLLDHSDSNTNGVRINLDYYSVLCCAGSHGEQPLEAAQRHFLLVSTLRCVNTLKLACSLTTVTTNLPDPDSH